MNINAYLAKQYTAPGCWALVADVLIAECAQTVDDFRTINSSVRSIASAFSLALHKSKHGFIQIAAPVDFCVVLLGRTEKLGIHHAGIYYQGRILHALPDSNQYQEMSSISDEYALIEYWAKA